MGNLEKGKDRITEGKTVFNGCNSEGRMFLRSRNMGVGDMGITRKDTGKVRENGDVAKQ